MSFLYVILIAIAIIVYLIYKKQKPVLNNSSASEEYKITEEDVSKRQLRFEKDFELALECSVPDKMDGKEIYIYRNLMSGWYNKISGDNRYDDKMIQKIRKDWCDYMDSVEDRNTYNFLHLEKEVATDGKEQKKEPYWDKHVIASKKVFAIEDAFASMMGKKAVEELARIRGKSLFMEIDENGNLAPEGFEFNQNSGSEGKLIKK